MKIKTLLLSMALVLVPASHAELNLEIPETILSSSDMVPSGTGAVNFSSSGLRRLRALRNRGRTVEDPELNAWVRGIGMRLLAQTSYKGRPFYFAIVKDDQVNAYATQGGLIVINSGLVLRSSSESELAGVMAHEIAHVTQQHIERMIARSKNNAVGNTAAVVAGLLVGTQNPEAGQAIVTSALAFDAHNSLKFSRSAETEADREGLRILVNAKFDPKGMAGFLGKLDDGVPSNFADIGQYLTSHPLSAQRVSDISQRAARYGPYRGQSQPSYDYMKQRLHILTRSPGIPDKAPAFATRYASAYKLSQQGKSAMVVQMLKSVAKQLPELTLLAQAYLQLNQYQNVIQTLQSTYARYPLEESVIMPMAEAYIGLKQYEKAWQLVSRVRLVEQTSLDFLALRQEVARLSGRLGEAYLSVAERNIRIGEYKHALTQLSLASRTPKLTPIEGQTIQRAIYRAKRFKK